MAERRIIFPPTCATCDNFRHDVAYTTFNSCEEGVAVNNGGVPSDFGCVLYQPVQSPAVPERAETCDWPVTTGSKDRCVLAIGHDGPCVGPVTQPPKPPIDWESDVATQALQRWVKADEARKVAEASLATLTAELTEARAARERAEQALAKARTLPAKWRDEANFLQFNAPHNDILAQQVYILLRTADQLLAALTPTPPPAQETERQP